MVRSRVGAAFQAVLHARSFTMSSTYVLVRAAGVEPASCSRPLLMGYKPTALPLSYARRVAPLAGIEPATPAASTRRSTGELQAAMRMSGWIRAGRPAQGAVSRGRGKRARRYSPQEKRRRSGAVAARIGFNVWQRNHGAASTMGRGEFNSVSARRAHPRNRRP